MRTTLTLDADVARRVRSEVRRTGKTFKAVVNDAIKAGLGRGGSRPRGPRVQITPHHFGFRAGVDPDRLNQLVDELETEERSRR
jgi:hypothetical protein